MPSKPSNLKPKPNHDAQPGTTELSFEAIGTRWFIELPGTNDFPSELITEIQQTIDVFDSRYSRFRGDSFVTRMSHETGSFILPDDAQPMFDLYAEMYKITDGLMTPLIGRPLSDAGYDSDYTLEDRNPEPAPAWEDVIDYAFPMITVKEPALLDFGAAGKGYMVDLISEVIEKYDVKAYLVNGGGDMRSRSTKESEAVAIGLENPDEPNTYIGMVKLHNKSLCGSAGNRRAWGKYNHIMNPKTAISPQHIRAIWAVADTTLLADALTTALYFVGADPLRENYSFEYAIIYADHSLEHSSKFPAEFFTQQ
jgi:thiamine biosynthesis lipoprotein